MFLAAYVSISRKERTLKLGHKYLNIGQTVILESVRNSVFVCIQQQQLVT